MSVRCIVILVPAQVLNANTDHKQLERATALLPRLKVHYVKRVFVTDEKFFYLRPSVSNQNNGVGKKADVKQSRLLTKCEKFAQHVMVVADECFGGKERLRCVDESANKGSVSTLAVSIQLT